MGRNPLVFKAVPLICFLYPDCVSIPQTYNLDTVLVLVGKQQKNAVFNICATQAYTFTQ